MGVALDGDFFFSSVVCSIYLLLLLLKARLLNMKNREKHPPISKANRSTHKKIGRVKRPGMLSIDKKNEVQTQHSGLIDKKNAF
jgi:hypothetical protein